MMNNAEEMQTTAEKAAQTAVQIPPPLHLGGGGSCTLIVMTAKGIFELVTFDLDGDRNIGLL